MRGVVAVCRSDRTVGELEQPRGWRVERLASGAVLEILVVAICVREVIEPPCPLLVLMDLGVRPVC